MLLTFNYLYFLENESRSTPKLLTRRDLRLYRYTYYKKNPLVLTKCISISYDILIRCVSLLFSKHFKPYCLLVIRNKNIDLEDKMKDGESTFFRSKIIYQQEKITIPVKDMVDLYKI